MVKEKMFGLVTLSIMFATLSAGTVKTEHKDGGIELSNGKIAARAASEKSGEVEVLYWLNGRKFSAASIFPVCSEGRFRTEYSVKDQTSLRIRYVGLKTGDAEMTLRISPNHEYIEFVDFNNVGELKINFNSQALVLPDRLGEDIAIHPGDLAATVLPLPSGALFAVNLIDHGNAMLSCLWQSGSFEVAETQDISERRFDGMIVRPVSGQAFWIGVNAAEGIWHQVKEKLDATVPAKIAWTPPLAAQWMAVMRKEKGIVEYEDGLCESWRIIVKNQGEKAPRPQIDLGIIILNTATWQAWASGLGSFAYPCNFENDSCLIQYPLFRSHEHATYDGKVPVLIYPFMKTKESPQNLLLPIEAVSRLMDKEAVARIIFKRTKYYPATCEITNEIEKIFYRGEQLKSRNRIIERLQLMDVFVANVRNRIEEYIDWSNRMLKELDLEQKRHPELEERIKQFTKPLNAMRQRYAEAKDRMNTPEHYLTLSGEMAKLVDAKMDDEKQEEEAKRLGRLIRTIGGAHDLTVASMRCHVKCIRQQSILNGMTAADQPGYREICKWLREQTTVILQPKINMEGK